MGCEADRLFASTIFDEIPYDPNISISFSLLIESKTLPKSSNANTVVSCLSSTPNISLHNPKICAIVSLPVVKP